MGTGLGTVSRVRPMGGSAQGSTALTSRRVLRDRWPETWRLRASHTGSVRQNFRGGLAGDSNFRLSVKSQSGAC